MISRKTSITACTIVMIAVLVLLLLVSEVGAVPVEEWNRNFKTLEQNNPLPAIFVQQTSDGGYIILAGEVSMSERDIIDVWLIKTDAKGKEQWRKKFGGSKADKAYSVQETKDGGYIIAGYTRSYGAGLIDVWLVKTDSKGNEKWNKTFGGSEADGALSIQQTTDGGYILAGMTESYGNGDEDFWLIKSDANGDEMWNKTFGRATWIDRAYSVQQTIDGGYILGGITTPNAGGAWDAWLIKTDANGNQQWSKTFGGSSWDRVYSVQQTSDGGYILAGDTGSYGGGSDAWLIKADSDGNEMWNKTFGIGTESGNGKSVQQTTDGGYILVGVKGYAKTESEGVYYGSNIWLIKTDSNGNEMWNRTFEEGVEAYSVQQTKDGGYIIAASSVIKVSDTDAGSMIRKETVGIGTTPSKVMPLNMEKPTEKSTPGFEILGAILSMFMIIFLLRRRKA